MLAVARALMLRPKLMLLDEPSFGLAPLVVRRAVRHPGADQRGREGVGMLIVEQNAALALGSRRPGLPARDRPHRACPGAASRASRGRGRAPRLSGLLRGAAMELFIQQLSHRHRHRRHLCLHGAGRRDDLPGDPPPELRPGRDGDVLDLHRLAAAAWGLPFWVAFVVTVGAVVRSAACCIERVVFRPIRSARRC